MGKEEEGVNRDQAALVDRDPGNPAFQAVAEHATMPGSGISGSRTRESYWRLGAGYDLQQEFRAYYGKNTLGLAAILGKGRPGPHQILRAVSRVAVRGTR